MVCVMVYTGRKAGQNMRQIDAITKANESENN